MSKAASESGAFKKKGPVGGGQTNRQPDPRLFENTAGFRLAETILDRSKTLDPELGGKPPRRCAFVGPLDHEHLDLKPIYWTFAAAVATLSLMVVCTYSRFHELPVPALSLSVIGIVMAAVVIFTYVPPGCDCRLQKRLIKKGSSVTGQITEKHSDKQDDGKLSFQLDYAFQPENSEESYWGRMKVSRQHFIEYDEGDDLTVVYMRHKGQIISRPYRCCAYRAEGVGRTNAKGSQS